MKRFQVWGATVALAVGLGGPAAAADAPAPGEPTTLMKKLFGPKTPKRVEPTADSKRPATITAPLPQEVLTDALRAEQFAWQRRVSVCVELRQVAEAKGDTALARQADELERQATALYHQRVAGLGLPKPKTPSMEPSASFAADTLTTDSTAAEKARRLAGAPTPVPGTTTAQVREVKP